jgi:N6-L-threonylcarbamoyladenine synthase
MIILGIETSCDETAASVVRGDKGRVEVLSNIVSSQIEIHKKYGGVVPEVAAREHVPNIIPVVHEALKKAGVVLPTIPQLTRDRHFNKEEIVHGIAVTVGPGLITSLIIGVETAKTLAYAWGLPVVAVNHIEGHIYANFISENPRPQIPNSKQIQGLKFQIQNKNIKFPIVILTVSGGHTMLVLMTGHGKYQAIGETRDDAAGEAFDKAAQLLELGYPGGPAIAIEATKWRSQILNSKPQTNSKTKILSLKQTQNAKNIVLPRPMLKDKNFEFSFSGLKTALLYQIKKDVNWQKRKAEYAAEFQQAVVDVLVEKTVKAALFHQAKTVMLSGGVSANKELREQLKKAVVEKLSGVGFVMPDLKYCTDNAAMIACAGYFQAKRKKYTPWQKLGADCNLELK